MNLPTRATIPDDVSDEDASFVVLGDVALHGVRRARPGLGDSVAVFGQGGLGQMVTQFARMAGAYPVVAVDLLDERLDQARWSGATHTVNAQREDAVAAVQDHHRWGRAGGVHGHAHAQDPARLHAGSGGRRHRVHDG